MADSKVGSCEASLLFGISALLKGIGFVLNAHFIGEAPKLLNRGEMAIRNHNTGFSLVELLIGMFIAVSLYAVAVGPTKAYVDKQKLQRCAENLRKLHLTLSLYANEHDGAFPERESVRSAADVLFLLVPKYTADTSLFVCPATGRTASGGRVDYACAVGLRKESRGDSLLLSDAQVNGESKAQGTKVFSETGGQGSNHGKAGGNLVFADGHLETIGCIAPRDLSLPDGAKLLNPMR